MNLISPVLRTEFREFCVSFLVLRQIHDIFTMAGIKRGILKADIPISGERRKLVEEYFSSINWSDEQDTNKFLQAISFTIAQSYLNEDNKNHLKKICQQEGLTIDGINVYVQSGKPQYNSSSFISNNILTLKNDFHLISQIEPQKRGFEFERFLNELFALFNLAPKKSFRITGEQIDGSFQINDNTYLLEAKWQAKQTSQDDLLIFRGKVESKSTWARGVFISYSGFTDDGLTALSKGKATNIIGINGQDLHFILNGEISLVDAINKKARRAVETGAFFVSVFDIMRS